MFLLPPIMKKSGFSPFVEIWSSNGTSTVPGNNPQWATIVSWGGGGAGEKGDAGSAQGGSGGAGGNFSISSVNVVGISQLHIVVGAGGTVHSFSLTGNAGQNTVVRYTNSTGTIVARADRSGGTTTVRTDYANIVNYFVTRQANGGSGTIGAGSGGMGGGGGAPGSDTGDGGSGQDGTTWFNNIFDGNANINDNNYGQGILDGSGGQDHEFFPPNAYANNRLSLVGYGGYGGDGDNGTIPPGTNAAGQVLSTSDAMHGRNGAVIIFWGDPSYWDGQNWRTDDTDSFFD